MAHHLKSETGSFIFWKSVNEALRIGNEPEDIWTRTFLKNDYLHLTTTHVLSSRLFHRLRLRWMRTASEDHAYPRPGYEPSIRGVYRKSTAYTYGGEWQFTYHYHSSGNLIWGVDSQVDDVSAIQFGDRRLWGVAFYLQNNYALTPTLKTSLGGRWDITGGWDVPTVREFNPRMGLNYALTEADILRLSLGKGFRAPSIGERFVSTFANLIRVMPNPDLEPERSLAFELGYTKTLWGIAQTNVAFFFSDYWNLIEPTVDPEKIEVRFENVTRARIQGIDASFRIEWKRDQAHTQLAYTYIHSTDLSRYPDGSPTPDYGKVLKYRPRHMFYANTSFHLWGFLLGADFRYISKFERVDKLTAIPDINIQVPTYVTDVRVGWKLGALRFTFLVNNLFQYYYLQAPGNLGPLRHFTLQVEWRN